MGDQVAPLVQYRFCLTEANDLVRYINKFIKLINKLLDSDLYALLYQQHYKKLPSSVAETGSFSFSFLPLFVRTTLYGCPAA